MSTPLRINGSPLLPDNAVQRARRQLRYALRPGRPIKRRWRRLQTATGYGQYATASCHYYDFVAINASRVALSGIRSGASPNTSALRLLLAKRGKTPATGLVYRLTRDRWRILIAQFLRQLIRRILCACSATKAATGAPVPIALTPHRFPGGAGAAVMAARETDGEESVRQTPKDARLIPLRRDRLLAFHLPRRQTAQVAPVAYSYFPACPEWLKIACFINRCGVLIDTRRGHFDPFARGVVNNPIVVVYATLLLLFALSANQ